jgi:hypothetical protein
MHALLEQCLTDLEERIDEEVEQRLLDEWKQFCTVGSGGGVFSPRRARRSEPGFNWPDVHINDTIDDFDLMAIQQLADCSSALANASGGVLCARANYGVGILPTQFGAELYVMDRQQGNLPTSRPMGVEAIEPLLAGGLPDLHAGLGDRTLQMGRHFRQIMRDYPKVARFVHVYHPDLQGPMDVCELLLGSGLFLAVVDRPGEVKQLLSLISEAYIRFMDAWHAIAPPPDGYATHWSMMHRGTVMLRDDSAMNFSPDMFEEFIEPYEQRVLDRCGGGVIHSCGRVDHYVHRLPHMEGLYAFQMSQPECNDMDRVFEQTLAKGLRLIGLARSAVDDAQARGVDLHGLVHCW